MSLVLQTNLSATGQLSPSGKLNQGSSLQDQLHRLDEFTTFRKDYKAPPNDFVRTKVVDPVPPASVIHKNSCYLKLQNSLTQSTYRPPNDTTPNVLQQYQNLLESDSTSGMDSSRMYASHFHLSADKRLETHCTTNQDGFKLKECDKNSNHSRHVLLAKGSSSKSNPGPLGNKAFSNGSGSEYFSSFTGSCSGGGGRSVFVKGRGCGVSPRNFDKHARNTVTGSLVSGEGGGGVGLVSSEGGAGVTTTHRSTFQGAPLQCSNPLSQTAHNQQLRLTAIPQGDRAMMEQPQTNHQASFCQTPSSPDERSGAYNKLEAVKAINGSSIRVDDYTTAAREYFSTTTSDTYRHPPKSGRRFPVVRFAPNESFLPRGDLDPGRARLRISRTTTRSAHPKPPAGYCYPVHVDSSNLHTFSHVHLGSSPLQAGCLSTMADSYHPIARSIKRVRAPAKDNIPLDYYPGHLGHSTTADSYPSHAGVRLEQPHPTALHNLKCSHWQLPCVGEANYGTTHRTCFTAPSKQL